ncbi:MAG: hypothetical protein ACRETL_16770, partial [Gammaproteobacteria bacterium]
MPIHRRFIPASQRRPVFSGVPGRPDLKRFIGFEGDPGTEPARAHGGLGYLGVADRHTPGFPRADGTPGNPINGDYNERMVWGTADNGAVTAPLDPSVPVPPIPGPTEFDPGLSIPFGVSVIRWKNPTTMQSVPILASTPVNVPVLSLNMNRNALLIQNNSSATSPDVPPTFYIGFNSQPQVGLSLAIPPLAGILFDIITPRDAIYVLQAGGAGASQIIQGCVIQGTY